MNLSKVQISYSLISIKWYLVNLETQIITSKNWKKRMKQIHIARQDVTISSQTIRNQSTVNTAKRLASLFWYLIASTIDTIHNTINAWLWNCMYIWNSKYNLHICMIKTNADFLYFKNILFMFLVDFKLRKSS